MRPAESPLYTADQIREKVREIAAKISEDYAGRDPVLLIVLKGGLHFGSDLSRAMTIPVAIDFIRAKSYAGTESGETVEFLVLPNLPLEDRHVVIVEDILDTGRTARALFDKVGEGRPASVAFCTLFDKPVRREAEVEAAYVGFRIEDHFVVGYGMDFEEQYRELPDVHVLENPL